MAPASAMPLPPPPEKVISLTGGGGATNCTPPPGSLPTVSTRPVGSPNWPGLSIAGGGPTTALERERPVPILTAGPVGGGMVTGTGAIRTCFC